MDQSASIFRPTIITQQLFGATYEVVIPVDVGRPYRQQGPTSGRSRALLSLPVSIVRSCRESAEQRGEIAAPKFDRIMGSASLARPEELRAPIPFARLTPMDTGHNSLLR